jgi:hypothetical protein
MPRQVLFIQGGGEEGTHDEWDNELAESLGRELGPGYEIRYPRMPNEADPKYARWKAALEKEFAKLIPQAVVRRLTGRDHQLDNDMSEVAADIRRLG